VARGGTSIGSARERALELETLAVAGDDAPLRERLACAPGAVAPAVAPAMAPPAEG
jgi:hypothetical protein